MSHTTLAQHEMYGVVDAAVNQRMMSSRLVRERWAKVHLTHGTDLHQLEVH